MMANDVILVSRPFKIGETPTVQKTRHVTTRSDFMTGAVVALEVLNLITCPPPLLSCPSSYP